MKKLILIIIFVLISSLVFAETWELAVAKQDEADLASGHKRKKQFDVIAVMPKGHPWSVLERKHHLIVIVDGLTQAEAEALKKPQYRDGIEPDPATGIAGEIVGKRRYKLDKTRLESLTSTASVNWKDALDMKKDYQPLKDGDVKIDFKVTKGVYDKIEVKTINYGTAAATVASP